MPNALCIHGLERINLREGQVYTIAPASRHVCPAASFVEVLDLPKPVVPGDHRCNACGARVPGPGPSYYVVFAARFAPLPPPDEIHRYDETNKDKEFIERVHP